MESFSNLRQTAIQFLDNNGFGNCIYCNGAQNVNSSDHPTKAIISLLSDRATSYEIYIEVYNELIGAYNDLYSSLAIEQYNQPLEQLSNEN